MQFDHASMAMIRKHIQVYYSQGSGLWQGFEYCNCRTFGSQKLQKPFPFFKAIYHDRSRPSIATDQVRAKFADAQVQRSYIRNIEMQTHRTVCAATAEPTATFQIDDHSPWSVKQSDRASSTLSALSFLAITAFVRARVRAT